MHIKSLRTIRTILIVTLLFLGGCVGAVCLYSKYIEKPVLSYAPLPFPIIAKAIYPGGVATATAGRCNSTNSVITYKSSRQLQRENSNQAALVLESVMITIQPGCSTVSTRVNVVPDGTPPGFYRFSGVAVIKGLMADHEVPWNTDVFEVLAKPATDAEPPAAPMPLTGASAAPLLLPINNAVVKIEVKP